MDEYTSLKNNFLIAMPGLVDPNFFRSVTYICEHNEEGAMGVVVNQPTNMYLQEILEQINIPIANPLTAKQIVFTGGPVEEGHLFVIHRPIGPWESSMIVTNDVAVTTSKDILEAMAKDEGPEDYLIALGYAGWGPGQLEQEMAENAWLHVPASQDILFDTPANKRWTIAAKRMGVDLEQLSDQVGHA